MKSVIAILCLGRLFLPQLHSQDNCGISGTEKKFVAGCFGNDAVAEPVSSVNGTGAAGYLQPGDCVYVIRQGGATSGFFLSTSAAGRFDRFDYCIIFSIDLKVKEVKVTVYRSTYGAAICRKSWLDQFTGYAGEELEPGKDIDAVSGGTISSASLVTDIKRSHELMTRLKAQGTI